MELEKFELFYNFVTSKYIVKLWHLWHIVYYSLLCNKLEIRNTLVSCVRIAISHDSREWFMLRNIRIMCWNIDRERRKRGPDAAGVRRFISRRTLRFYKSMESSKARIKSLQSGRNVLDRRRMLRVWQTPDIAWREVIERRHKDRTRLREEAESLEFRQDVIAWRRRIFMILELISALLTLVYMYFCTIIIARYYIMFITIYAIFFRCSKLRSSVFAQSTEILNIQFFIHRIIEWFKNYTL